MNRMTTGRRKHACVKVGDAVMHCADQCSLIATPIFTIDAFSP